jgi:outer membrane protein assembly factor BamA
LGAALELNEADIYSDILSGDAPTPLEEYLQRNPSRALISLLNIPTGYTLAASQRIGVTWDQRDSAVSATRGTLLSVNVEHVNAFPIDSSESGAAPQLASDFKSHFLQYTGRVAAYLSLNERGLALATSLRWGFNHQLESGSSTYPDRLFFLGGVDSLRGFPLSSLVPEDWDRRLQAPEAGETQLTEDEIPVRGGNLFLNPRAELRIPIVGIWQTAVFLDTGNLWLESSEVLNAFRLRYSAGLGLRVNTPVGPLALDYGVNLDRRYYESFGAFHFSIGLF